MVIISPLEDVKQVSPKEKKKLTEQALAEIRSDGFFFSWLVMVMMYFCCNWTCQSEWTCHNRQGVSKIGLQKAGAPFVPPEWSEKYKPILGPYKQSLG